MVQVGHGFINCLASESLFFYLFIRSYLQTWGDHAMRSIVLPWYPGGHVLSFVVSFSKETENLMEEVLRFLSNRLSAFSCIMY